jgi:hypothetical protein
VLKPLGALALDLQQAVNEGRPERHFSKEAEWAKRLSNGGGNWCSPYLPSLTNYTNACYTLLHLECRTASRRLHVFPPQGHWHWQALGVGEMLGVLVALGVLGVALGVDEGAGVTADNEADAVAATLANDAARADDMDAIIDDKEEIIDGFKGG